MGWSYRSIVTDHERTGRDLSLRNYNHRRNDATTAKQSTIAATIERSQSLGGAPLICCGGAANPRQRGELQISSVMPEDEAPRP
ncbi:hypothetical protein H8S95_12715 [Pontibacter sp. KCTC 32443]|uniref:hypothetical protein n=1 Tax=Pontibacter TaxID=323449 RepID=UPI00164E4D3A|nr:MULTISPECIES: hypothetical protein [Pontibacter]MBC5774931.1 hypothetical protein [Pontibacter sp. KCTC 32443]